jgi:hypothetical protein
MSSKVSSLQITELKPIKASVLKLCNSGKSMKKLFLCLTKHYAMKAYGGVVV